ncbi:MAG: dienelactone hydrolase family protein [Ornithinimicrobium sp.]
MLVDLSEASARRGGSAHLSGYLGAPMSPGPHPGVVVVHEAFGLDENTRRHTQRLASMGYVALAVDLFSAGGAVRCLAATMVSFRRGRGRAFTDIETARLSLLGREDVNDRIGIIGFCLGGAFALLTAEADTYRAASVNYGMLPRTLDGLSGLCPVVASYGGADRSLSGAADILEEEFSRHGIPHDVYEYDGTGHSFLNEVPAGPRPLRPLLRVCGIGPDQAAASDAWDRIEAFFDTHLRG